MIEIGVGFSLLLAVLGSTSILLFVREVKENPAFVFIGLTVYSALSKQLSVLYLETYPTLITESATYSFYNGAAARFFVYNISIFAVAALTSRYLDARFRLTGADGRAIRLPKIRDMRLSTLAIAAVIALQLGNLALSSGLPLPGAKVTRWTYWDEAAAFPILSEIFGTLMAFCPLTLAIVCFSARRLRLYRDWNVSWMLFVLYLVFLVLTGQRFHGFLWPYVLFGGTYLIFRVAEGKSILISRFTVFSVVGVVSLLGYGVVAMAERGIAEFSGGAASALVYRALALQGHTYWNMDVNVSDYGGSWDLSALLAGMETIILTVGNPAVAEAYLAKGINFSAGFPTIAIYVFGFIGAIPACVGYGLLLGATAYLLLSIIERGRVFLAFPASYLWLWVHSTYGYASVETILSAKFAVFASITLFCLIFFARDDSEAKAASMFAPRSYPRLSPKRFPS